ncbi:MAG: ribonuclease III [Proteobacteria bacterium]|nr:ribonuclease III [Pseudomonadota bacterium]
MDNEFVGYQFKNQALLSLALTHRSLGNSNNERLEYLGDAILDFVITEYIYHEFPDSDEGELTRLRASLVKGEKLAEIANEIKLSESLKLGAGELKSGGWRRDSILANTVEALIGAVYLDSGIESCRHFILNLYQNHLKSIDPTNIKKDAKTRLQEYLQSRKQSVPTYKVIDELGTSHQPEFTVSCQINLIAEPIIAKGTSKRKAEQAAAKKAISLLKDKTS